MARRRTTPRARPRKTSTPAPALLTDGLPAPNLNCQHYFEPCEAAPYGMLHLLRRDPKDDETIGAFVDRRYGLSYLDCREYKQPPSWMDPHKFERMCLRDPLCVQLRDKVVQSPTPQNLSRLQQRVEQVFVERYLPYLRRQFAEVSGLLAHWLVACEGYRRETPPARRRQKPK